jgi:exopolyphosphatase/guanosine-5'-triphosphate,3'-diphosphate pyrophosphatase
MKDKSNKKIKINEMGRISDIGHLGIASVLDLGSNSVKLVNYKINYYNNYKPYHQESVRLKLSEGLEKGFLKEEYVDKTIETLKLFRNIVDFEDVNYVISVATSAIREAENQLEIIERIQKETGFNFKILSEHNEAIFSYTGAIRSLKIPSVLFFDIGGGSLEIVLAKDFEIKKIVSLPLGALRLTQMFSKDSKFEITNFYKMEKYIFENIPTKEELGISKSEELVLVGVGGVLRALAKYDQYSKKYALSKLHNYEISLNSLETISKRIRSLPVEKIAKIESIGSGRADTVRAGNLVITQLMKKLGFNKVTVSAHGLREGTLALSLQYPKEFENQNISYSNIKEIIYLSSQAEELFESVEDFIKLLFSKNLLSDHERFLLAYALTQIDKLWSFRDADNVLYSIMDDDSSLNHRDQLISALSLIYSKKRKKTDPLILKYENILELNDKKLVKKISSIVSFCDIFHKTCAKIKVTSESQNSITLSIYPKTNIFPEVLLQQVCERLEGTLDISIKSNVFYQTSTPSTSGPIRIA